MTTQAARGRPAAVSELPRVFRRREPRIISVTGGKGGVGKSSVAVNLALGLQALGGRILLLDGDLGLANADQLLGVRAASTLWTVIRGEIALENAVVETPYGISLLPACSGREEMANLGGEAHTALVRGVRGLAGRFDFVVVDTAAGIGTTAIGLASAGDTILDVTTPDPTAVRDAFSIAKVLSKGHGVRRIELVVNMVSGRDEGLDLFRRLSAVAGRFLPVTLGLAGCVVHDPCVAKAVRERRPFLSAYPASAASRQIRELATHVVRLDREALAARGCFENRGKETP
ncbi:MAG: P-loop NTPase [Deltaproteobacteria bacterium]|nr:P-loop NTPase [Deltaproteobacteria bacterium]